MVNFPLPQSSSVTSLFHIDKKKAKVDRRKNEKVKLSKIQSTTFYDLSCTFTLANICFVTPFYGYKTKILSVILTYRVLSKL